MAKGNHTHVRHGAPNKRTTIEEAFRVHSNHGSAMECGDCPFFANGWCRIKAAAAMKTTKVCTYGWMKSKTDRAQRRTSKRKEAAR